ncbi:MAG TPA: cell division protein FtsL [Deltaproteobacteria bacterium]|nr:cell division protein FtsL [Deltaproteobacteria bacterium]
MKTRMAQNYLPSCIIILLLFTVWAVFHVWTRHMVTELGYDISAQQAVKEGLLSDNKSLKLEISTLKSSRRLEVIAKNSLGLQTPKNDQVVYLCLDE